MNEKIIIYDGSCLLCNGFIRFVIKRDAKKSIMFKPNKFLTNNQYGESIKYLVNGTELSKSDAFLKIVSDLGGIWLIFSKICIVVPKIIRDSIYDFVADNRYNIFGKSSCLLPKESIKSRII